MDYLSTILYGVFFLSILFVILFIECPFGCASCIAVKNISLLDVDIDCLSCQGDRIFSNYTKTYPNGDTVKISRCECPAGKFDNGINAACQCEIQNCSISE